jgi:transglutaminase-like putative cysteine protease
VALEELLEDGVELPDHMSLDLATAREATYVFHNEVSYEYPAPIRALRHQFVVLPPHRHGDQRRVAHRVHADVPHCALVRHRHDRFGNPIVAVRAPEVPERLGYGVRAVLHRSRDHDTPRPWRPIHTASTALTAADRTLAADARGFTVRAGGDPLRTALAIGEAVRAAMTYELGVTGVRTSAAEAWALRRGVCQDMAHVMISMCRSRGLAARYVSGHLLGEGASHAWVEVDAGGHTVAYDPTHGRETDLRYVTVAVGRDYRDVAPTAGTYGSGPRGRLSVRKRVAISAVR